MTAKEINISVCAVVVVTGATALLFRSLIIGWLAAGAGAGGGGGTGPDLGPSGGSDGNSSDGDGGGD